MGKIEEVLSYKTTDGRIHETLLEAKFWQKEIEDIDKANKLLNDGKSVAGCLRFLGFTGLDPILERVNKNTKLVISHWQCRDTPGYQVKRFNMRSDLLVGGDAGSSWGYYESYVNVWDLVGYAKHKNTIFEN